METVQVIEPNKESGDFDHHHHHHHRRRLIDRPMQVEELEVRPEHRPTITIVVHGQETRRLDRSFSHKSYNLQ